MSTIVEGFFDGRAAAGVSVGGAALPARIARAQGATDRPGGSGEPEQTRERSGVDPRASADDRRHRADHGRRADAHASRRRGG